MSCHETSIQIELLPSDSNFGSYVIKRSEFSFGDTPFRIFIPFGLQPQDLGRCHRTDSACFGDTVFDNTFDINAPEAQQAILVRIINSSQVIYLILEDIPSL